MRFSHNPKFYFGHYAGPPLIIKSLLIQNPLWKKAIFLFERVHSH
jgi:hypothetical protein